MSKTATIIITFIITALFSAGGIYYWQNSQCESQKETILNLENSLTELQDNSCNPEDIEPEIIMPECPDYNLPAISYGRAGLLTETEKSNFIEKFIQPYVDYYRDMPEDLISMDIMVPANAGEAYEITSIMILGDNVLRQGFLFGARDYNYDYWAPECMGECPFSNEFRTKYPQIVE